LLGVPGHDVGVFRYEGGPVFRYVDFLGDTLVFVAEGAAERFDVPACSHKAHSKPSEIDVAEQGDLL
jgi:hypothetical protein